MSARSGSTSGLSCRLLIAVLGTLLVLAGSEIWNRRPRARDQDPAFVMFGPDGDAVHLPIARARCALEARVRPEHEDKRYRTCEFEVEGQTVRFVAHDTLGERRCQAELAGRSLPCRRASVNRGYPELAIHIVDPLGTTHERRQLMRLLDPLSHVSECDWIWPQLGFALACAIVAGYTTTAALAGARPWLRYALAGFAALFALPAGGLIAVRALLSLGYID